MNKNTMNLPTMFREALARAGLQAIDDWWAQLDMSSRSEALHLWHECNQEDSSLAMRVEAVFADSDEESEKSGFWHSDYYDYLVNHEIYLFAERRFHVCTQHPMAAAAVRAGYIPHDFSCPLQRGDCAMRQLLSHSPGRSLQLRISVGKANVPISG